ncbi:LCP family protein, partial [Sciscionella sediminilitoris]|uniref:LCP family protein n=1 Tax=Sciscionella sediminilitoris TaxID=1445613 RepID=UPI0005698297
MPPPGRRPAQDGGRRPAQDPARANRQAQSGRRRAENAARQPGAKPRSGERPSPTPHTQATRPVGQPRSSTARRRARNRHRMGLVSKILIATLSLCVFAVSAYAWVTITRLNNSLTTADIGGQKAPDGSMDILLIGMDSRTDAQGNPLPKDLLDRLHAGSSDGEINTDTLILVHIPNDGRKATAVSIPRDSYVQIPGHGKHKINSAFGRAKNDEFKKLQQQGIKDPRELEVKSNQAGEKLTIQTVEQLTGMGIDHFAQVNLAGFYDISKAIGGVPVCLKQAVNDKQYSGAVFAKGEQTVQGAKALAFVRQRHNIPGGSTDLQRNRRQQAFLAGMAHKILSAGTLTDPGALNNLIGAVSKSLVIDQGWDVTGFAQQMQNLTGGAMTFSTIPVESLALKTDSDGEAVKVDPQKVNEFIRGQVGEKPAAPKSSAAAPPGQADNKGTTVDVRNGTGSSGLAGAVLDALGKKGFTSGGTGNSSSRSSTVIRYPSGGRS